MPQDQTTQQITMPRGTAVRMLIRYEIARRWGHHPDGRDARIADFIEEALNDAAPLLLGFDCDGDGLPDVHTQEEAEAALLAVATGTCECRAFVPSSDRTMRSPPPAAADADEKPKKRGGFFGLGRGGR